MLNHSKNWKRWNHGATAFWVGAALLACCLAGGCHTNGRDVEKPAMGPGQGAIAGQLVDPNGNDFDLEQAGVGGASSLRIDLISPAAGIVAAAYPKTGSSRFAFPNVPPGSYELSVYWVVPGKRTIAGSQTISVNPDQITPVNLVLTVKPLE